MSLTSSMRDFHRRYKRTETVEVGTIGGGGPGAPIDATYVVMSLDASLTAERVLTLTSPLILTDGGADGNATIDFADQAANTVFAGPVSGGNAYPTFRALICDDISNIATATARGSILRSDASLNWVEHAAATNHFILVGDGTDIVSKAFDWDDLNQGASADMVHDHTSDAEGGLLTTAGLSNVATATARGSILRSDASLNWVEHAAATNHFILVGDGTDIVSKAFDWDDMAAGASADMVHNHTSNAEGGVLTTAGLSDLAYGTPALTLSTSNAAGAANTVIRTDATILVFDATAPTTITPDASAATGSAGVAARRDHTHAITCAAPSSNLTVSTSNAEGVTFNFARADHSHAITSSSNPGAAASILATDAAGLLQLTRLNVAQYIGHIGDADTYMNFTANTLTFYIGGGNVFQLAAGSVACLAATKVQGSSWSITSDAGGLTQVGLWDTAGDIRTVGGLYVGSVAVDPVADWIYADGGMFIGDTLNGNQTIGLTINQGANDNEIQTYKSSDVAHGMTDLTETDTFGHIKKAQDTSGGMTITGYKDSDGSPGLAMNIYGFLGEAANTTKTQAGGYGIIDMFATVQSGATLGNMTADGNVLSVRSYRGGAAVCLFIIDEDGDLHVDGSTSLTGFDTYLDAELVRTVERALAPGAVIDGEWDRYVQYNEQSLVDAGILGDTVENGGLLNVTRLQRLHNGAIWQNHCQIQELKETVTRYEHALLALGMNPALLS